MGQWDGFIGWLDQEIGILQERIDWLKDGARTATIDRATGAWVDTTDQEILKAEADIARLQPMLDDAIIRRADA